MKQLLASLSKFVSTGVACIAISLVVCSPQPVMAKEMRRVDDQRLLAVEEEPENWLSYGRNYAQQRFSPLSQIHTHNVARLTPVWIYQTGVAATFQSTPLISDGVLYATVPGGDIVALDAATGVLRWRYKHKLIDRKLCCGLANRGAALGYGKVYVATPDAQLVALDENTGELVWKVNVTSKNEELSESLDDLAPDDPLREGKFSVATGLGTNMAPLVYQGRVYVGVTGAGYGLHIGHGTNSLAAVVGVRGHPGGRGYLAAFDAKDGSELWRWYSVPEKGWEGHFVERTVDGIILNRDIATERNQMAGNLNAWQGGGGSVWNTPSVDPHTGLLYIGTGNPAPQMDDPSRPGDNLYTSSLVAIEAETGDLHWYHQQVPHDRWGYDVASPPILFDWMGPGGVPRNAVGQASKTGWFYILDRITGELLLRSQAFVAQRNQFIPPNKEGVRIYPGAAGGASWSPVSFDPRTGFAYIAALHLPFHYQVHEPQEPNSQAYTTAKPLANESHGTLTAIDTTTGEHAWQLTTEEPLVGGVLSTAGDLLFFGEGNGLFAALDASNGKRLWSFQCGAGVNAPPVSYSVGGRQFVVIAAGGHQLFGFPVGDALIAFALPARQEAKEKSLQEERTISTKEQISAKPH